MVVVVKCFRMKTSSYIHLKLSENADGDACDVAVSWGLGIKKGAAEPEILAQDVKISKISTTYPEAVTFKFLFPMPTEDFR